MQAVLRNYSVEEILKAVLKRLQEEPNAMAVINDENDDEKNSMPGLLTELERIISDLGQANSLFECMKRSYFLKRPNCKDEEKRKAIEYDLIESFDNYTDVMDAIQDIIRKQEQDLRKSTYALYDIKKEMTSTAKQNLSLLKR